VYWKPVYYALEDGFELWLCNAHQRQERAGPQDRPINRTHLSSRRSRAHRTATPGSRGVSGTAFGRSQRHRR
jgi:hypothetical protein